MASRAAGLPSGTENQFAAQEIILGALLMIAAFAMGIMWSSAVEKPGELLTGIATLLLAAITFLLVIATKVLARSAVEDSRNRKIQATADAWIKLRGKLEFHDLTNVASGDIDAAGKAVLSQLRELEAFSQVVNSGVYDLDTFSRISGSWFVQQVRWIKPYIDQQQKQHPNVYKEIVDLGKRIENIPRQAQ